MSYSNKVNNILKNHGDEIITNIIIKRTPLPYLFMKLLNFVDVATLNMISTQNPYDKLFHLSISITTEKGLNKK